MKDYNLEYYVLGWDEIPGAPLLEWDEDSTKFEVDVPVEIDHPVELTISDPVPSNPKLFDYHCLPEPVISDRVKNVIEPMGMKGVQFLQAKIEMYNEEYFDYWLIRIYKQLPNIFDMKKSKYRLSEFGAGIMDMEKMILDNDEIEKYPLEERLMIVSSDYSAYEIVHESVVDKIKSIQPFGFKFWPILEWDDNIAFQ